MLTTAMKRGNVRTLPNRNLEVMGIALSIYGVNYSKECIHATTR
jgi:hypothetical protein